MSLSHFLYALNNNLSPSLIEFQNLKVCAANPLVTLEVREGKLYKDKKLSGKALDIFEYLKLKGSFDFFPAFIGYFSYEFSEYFDLAVSKKERRFPDAVFKLYDKPYFFLEESFNPKVIQKRNIKALVNEEEFLKSLNNIKNSILLGDVYQVNLSLPFSCNVNQDEILSIYYYLKKNNQSPFMGLFEHDGQWVISGSPERLFSLKDGILKTRPIAGTKPKGSSIEKFKNCKKENAEHIMLVDLMRNDLNKVCIPGSVKVTEDRVVEHYSHVMHLVSEVQGICDRGLYDIFKAIFPGGTVTGAPKKNVLKAIASEENYSRGPYTGAFGYISSGHGIDFNMLIRSIYIDKNEAIFNAGAGIVIDSVPSNEWLEVNKKAEGIKKIFNGENGARAQAARRHKAKILFLENHDSFSFNIINLLKTLDCDLNITYEACIPSDITHVIIGPGPGNPSSMPHITSLIENAFAKDLPILGICLGHQALGHYFGANIIKAPFPMHGKSEDIFHTALGLFESLLSPTPFTRYHSLVIDKTPSGFILDAFSKDGSIMAIRHEKKPVFGLQFHPESYLSKDGQKLLEKFIAY